MGRWTAHIDTFVRDRLPPAAAQPVFLFERAELQYPDHLNAAVDLIDRAVERGWGGRTAIIEPGRRWSYAELKAAADRAARVLAEDLGLVPGGRVLLRAPNSAALTVWWLAVLKAGGIAVCTMPLLREAELAAIVEKAQVGLALASAPLDAELIALQSRFPSQNVATFEALAPLAEAKPASFTPVDTHRDDPCLLAFTSGTTGKPKACVHYHRDVLAMADTFASHILKPTPDDVFVTTAPIAFTFGLGGAVVFPLRVGAATSFPPPGAGALLDHVATVGGTVLFTAPTSYRQMLARADWPDVSALRRCVSAGEPLPAATHHAWKDRTGLALIDGIGATEMMHIFISAADDDIRPGATGKPAPGFQAAILGEDGAPLPGAATGRLAVRGPSGCRYLDDARQSQYVQNGWNITGDTYRRDVDGYYWFVGRSDDMIVSSGYNIGAPEVEDALLTHPAVAECAVIGAPDPERGQVVKAFVVAHAPPADPAALALALQAHVKAAIAPYKYPRLIVFVDALPKTPTGKVQRHRLREP